MVLFFIPKNVNKDPGFMIGRILKLRKGKQMGGILK